MTGLVVCWVIVKPRSRCLFGLSLPDSFEATLQRAWRVPTGEATCADVSANPGDLRHKIVQNARPAPEASAFRCVCLYVWGSSNDGLRSSMGRRLLGPRCGYDSLGLLHFQGPCGAHGAVVLDNRFASHNPRCRARGWALSLMGRDWRRWVTTRERRCW
jgi:hypothetical protein